MLLIKRENLKRNFPQNINEKLNENREKEVRREENLKGKQGITDTSAGFTEEKLNEYCNFRITKL